MKLKLKKMKKVKLTCASGDDKLLQTQVYVQILLKHWKLEIEKKMNKKEAATNTATDWARISTQSN